MHIPENIVELNDKHESLLESMGFNSNTDSPLELCSPDAYQKTRLFTDEMITEMFGESPEPLKRVDIKIPSSIGMILIRPDMLHATPEFEKFISDRFALIHKETVTMTQEAYWQIYRHDLYRPETMHSRLTRAAICIGSECCLMVFKQDHLNIGGNVSDNFCTELKGSQGIYKPKTLRGDIVFRNALNLNLHDLNNPMVDSQIKQAVDPFRAYRVLASNPSEACASMQYPLLFYTGVGVHAPNSEEIGTDLSQFLPNISQLAEEALQT